MDMEKLTERFDNGQAAVMGCGKNCKYDYKYCRNHYEECPEINKIYERLAEYEDTGLTPEQIRELREKNTQKEAIYEIYGDQGDGADPDVWICPNCEAVYDIYDDYDFCPNCGQSVLK